MSSNRPSFPSPTLTPLSPNYPYSFQPPNPLLSLPLPHSNGTPDHPPVLTLITPIPYPLLPPDLQHPSTYVVGNLSPSTAVPSPVLAESLESDSTPLFIPIALESLLSHF